ncbi:50S ribosomal protein L37ae [Methanosalsum natronophilum]|uniref:Large ribosomal subunit protein eL43 n=1 Tax=Methanosalsum natronophilum TaxID=768733 RepID=A0A3R7WAT8_9EURY|nr:50S ribosomal protein L37ae [Methanosalsum natronophilum]MCS3924060.1 large subunit ribosomal protein L37Ae [Methanosalsum natronophilum]RQD80577.1 MAG: 50S ribosomal protein L37ae [Methanosalsum natronophilum]
MARKYSSKGHVTKSAGRFGTRYGRRDRKLVANIEEKMRKPYTCSVCAKPNVERKGTGVWECKKCGHSFTGGTYAPVTPVGKTVQRTLKKAMEEVE